MSRASDKVDGGSRAGDETRGETNHSNPSDGTRRTRTVLLVDDSAVVRSMVKIFLGWHNLEYLDADNGERAFHLLSVARVDLLIADIRMEGMDGITLVKRLRRSTRDALRLLPVILLTGDRTEETRTRGIEAGANCLLTKPVNCGVLTATVERLLVPSIPNAAP